MKITSGGGIYDEITKLRIPFNHLKKRLEVSHSTPLRLSLLSLSHITGVFIRSAFRDNLRAWVFPSEHFPTFSFEMNRPTLELIAYRIMEKAVFNLCHDGYVAFATMLIDKNNSNIPIITDLSKENFANFLRTLSPHLNAIIIISEAWTLMPDDVDLTIPVSENPKRIEAVFVSAHVAANFFLQKLLNATLRTTPLPTTRLSILGTTHRIIRLVTLANCLLYLIYALN